MLMYRKLCQHGDPVDREKRETRYILYDHPGTSCSKVGKYFVFKRYEDIVPPKLDTYWQEHAAKKCGRSYKYNGKTVNHQTAIVVTFGFSQDSRPNV